jgi:hypothetical protein
LGQRVSGLDNLGARFQVSVWHLGQLLQLLLEGDGVGPLGERCWLGALVVPSEGGGHAADQGVLGRWFVVLGEQSRKVAGLVHAARELFDG